MQELISQIKKGNPRMKYDFDTVVNRRNTDSLKWNVAENELPMWVADMDFKTAPEITEAIKAKADLGVYGYTEISKIGMTHTQAGGKDAIISGWKTTGLCL